MNGSKSSAPPRSSAKQWAQQIQEEGMLPDDPDDPLVKDSENARLDRQSEPVVGQDELDALRKDKARLDWLETQACWIGVRGEYDITPDYAVGGGYSVTVRAACDLAMSAVSEKGEK